MVDQTEWEQIREWIGRSDRVLIKKLSRNDCTWADDSGKHQAGFYVPKTIQESGFFPDTDSTNPDMPHIRDARFFTYWPMVDEVHESALKRYTNKGSECHCTRLPKSQFSGLPPASLLLGGVLSEPEYGAMHWFMVVSSVSEEAEFIETAFHLESDFQSGVFPARMLRPHLDGEGRLIEDLKRHIVAGTLEEFVEFQALPAPAELARAAQSRWLSDNQRENLDPFEIHRPGDAIMRISRDIEFDLYKRAERAHCVGKLASHLFQGEGPEDNLVRQFGELYSVFLSASQCRKSRGGRSFEIHVRRLLVDGRVRHEEQAVIGTRRPDFVMPDAASLSLPGREEAMILSLKTTLRERWKQVRHERHAALFLATVDDRISEPALNDMADEQIVVVVPESLKSSKAAHYEGAENVISFRRYFDEEISRKRPQLLMTL